MTALDKAGLVALADRVEALAGPCRETDVAIWLAETPGTTRVQWSYVHKATGRVCEVDETRDADRRLITVPTFTASLDAAMTLVPSGWLLSELNERNATGAQNWRWKATLWNHAAPRSIGQDAPTVNAYARKAHDAKCAPALALTAAALRAISAGQP